MKEVIHISSLYKGFIATKGKTPIEPYKGLDTFKTYAEAQKLPEFGGVLRDDTIMIDIDDGEQAEKLMSIIDHDQIWCRVTCTSRGKHFTFKNSGVEKCGTHLKLACGLVADIKCGSSCVEVLKVDGEERFCEWGEANPEAGEYDALPKWLHPVNTKMDFLTTKCRNSDLYGYILVLQSQLAMNNEDCRKTIQIINDFVLPEPLPQDELEVVMRDEAFDKPIFFEGNKFLHDAFGNWMINQHHIKRINGQLCVYADGTYHYGKKSIERIMVNAYPQIKRTQKAEVLDYLETICADESPSDATLIAFANGIFDLSTKTMRPFSPEIVITNKIPWDYSPDAYNELADKTLNKLACNDPEIRMLLEECIGYCFFRRNELSLAMFLTGEKANGKSTFLQMLKNVLGASNVSALGLDELDERFNVAMLSGKLANIGDDISDEFLHGRAIAHFKKIVSGNSLKAENKGQDPFEFEPIVKLIFSANQIPRMKDRTGAVLRRMVIIPFNATFTKDDPEYDPYISSKLKKREVMEYLCRLGIEGLERILENRSFTKSTKVDAEIEEYTVYNNPVLLFLKETEADEILNQETKMVHSKYEIFCSDNGFQSVGLSTFSKEITRQLNCRVVDKRIDKTHKGRVFVK